MAKLDDKLKGSEFNQARPEMSYASGRMFGELVEQSARSAVEAECGRLGVNPKPSNTNTLSR